MMCSPPFENREGGAAIVVIGSGRKRASPPLMTFSMVCSYNFPAELPSLVGP